MDSLCLTPQIAITGGCIDVRTGPSHVTASLGRSTAVGNAITAEKPTVGAVPSRPWGFSFKYPIRSLWPGGGGSKRHDAIPLDDAVLLEEKQKEDKKGGDDTGDTGEGGNGNWVLKILHVRREAQVKGGVEDFGEKEERENGSAADDDQSSECSCSSDNGDLDEQGCDFCRVDDDDERIEFDRDSFSKLLRRVSLADANLYAQMSYLGNLAYSISQIKPGNLLKSHGLRFVTSSLEKKEPAMKAEKENVLAAVQEPEETSKEPEEEKNMGSRISASAAYHVAASAASYLQSRTKSIIPFTSKSSEDSPDKCRGMYGKVSTMDNEVASFMATTDSVTAVVAAKEEVKQAVADDLNSSLSSPCEWFICDDDLSRTRLFVIQGSESFASWQANLLFEPIQFEGLDVIVHRGIYETAKGMYELMLPEVRDHLKSHGDRATFRFTGHSLGGSLSLLLNLMLLIRGEVPPSSLLPVITFGAPSIMCGGDRLLQELGLPRSHVQAITMHRDIVPRAFSCNYPNHVAELLKAINGNFRNHPCLNNQKLLYAPMGEFLILQPDQKLSPYHDLLPSGSGLYLLSCPVSDANEAEKLLQAAQSVFLNTPHPLEILSDRSAYGSDGTIQRDHDMISYWKAVWSVIRNERKGIRKAEREHRRKVWWPLLVPHDSNAGVIGGGPMTSSNVCGAQFNFSGILQNRRESLRRFTRLVASQHMHLLVVLFLPARLLIVGTQNVIGFR
ncbi:hypothetical protein Vadar_007880 [Vaccinium darrowii]|uniref:Uncharacterized protein n=1 Tax=Vaccinium darrowii TaxID=229202 RepID=A0ACB7X8A6_9ERIC|nr:hypothetical protein Vadar_007880 [Vaccinium darrowii]